MPDPELGNKKKQIVTLYDQLKTDVDMMKNCAKKLISEKTHLTRKKIQCELTVLLLTF